MDGFPPISDVSQGLLEEAAPAASSTHHHDGELFRGETARGEKANIVPFRRASPANAASLPTAAAAASLILVAPPTGTPVPDYARRIVSEVVAHGVAHKNVPLAPAEADTVVNAVLAALDLADLYRFSMGEPEAVGKAAQLIGDKLDEAALLRLVLFVLAVEDKENAHDPAIVEIVAAIAKEIATAATSGLIIWPDIADAVKHYYDNKPSVRLEDLPDGTTITVHLRGAQPHRDEREGAALFLHDVETGALRREAYFHEGKLHRATGPADSFHDPDGTVTENWYCHGVLHRDERDGPALAVYDVNGTVIEAFWYRHGDPYRESGHGPAHMWRCIETGHIHESYHRDGLYHRVTGWRIIKTVMASAGIAGQHACPKAFRHAFGIGTLQANVPINLTQRWLGHARISTTAIYASACGPEERAFASLFWNARLPTPSAPTPHATPPA